MDPVLFEKRLSRHYDELKWLFSELYDNDTAAFERLLTVLHANAEARDEDLCALDNEREQMPDWYCSTELLGMQLYVRQYAGSLNGLKERLDYINSCNVNYLHLMQILKCPPVENDGGYAIEDFRRIEPDLGTMEDLRALTKECRARRMSVCLDFVMNHTSNEHEWAKRARAGEKEYRDRFFFYDDRTIPDEFEKTVPEVFPTTAPGSFTYLEDAKKYVMTNFYPYQWDLNYGNPVVFIEMMDTMLFLANQGIDIIRVDAVPYIWKQLGTDCRNLPQVHTIVRMVRMICEIVCPGTLLLGEVVMAPEKLAPYFGTEEKPECHMLYNATTMCTTWHTVATQDTRLLRHQMEAVLKLPKKYVFLNYLRCHDDIGWGLDFPWMMENFGQGEIPHKKFVNDYFTGRLEGSTSRGELYNDDPRLGDARLCGTTASLCGMESALLYNDAAAADKALNADVMLHAWLFIQRGLPILYAGDEIGQLNDNGYHNDPAKCEDSRYLHRGPFLWDELSRLEDGTSVQSRLFNALKHMEQLRRTVPQLDDDAVIELFDTGLDSVLGLKRTKNGKTLTAVFNFARHIERVNLKTEGPQTDLLAGQTVYLDGTVILEPYGCVWAVER